VACLPGEVGSVSLSGRLALGNANAERAVDFKISKMLPGAESQGDKIRVGVRPWRGEASACPKGLRSIQHDKSPVFVRGQYN
jgi:hypothetical protein